MTAGGGRWQAGTLTHCAFFYRSQVEYASDVRSFVHEGLNAGEPALVVVPEAQLDLVRSILG